MTVVVFVQDEGRNLSEAFEHHSADLTWDEMVINDACQLDDHHMIS